MNYKEPLYITVMNIIKDRIIDGTYEIGQLIPTETEFEEEFKVSKITIRKAIELLEHDGYVQKKSGKGTTVLSNSIFNKISKTNTFAQLLTSSGKTLHKEKTEITKLELNPTDELYLHFKKMCTRITRMYYLNGEPFIYFTHYLPGDLIIPEIKDDDKFSIYSLLFSNKYIIKDFRDEFFIDYPSLKIMKALNLQNGPVLGRKRTSFSQDNHVIEIAYAQYNTNLSNYIVEYNL